MPPRNKQKPAAKAAKAATAAEDDADLDAMLDAAIRENQAVAGSPAALRLEQEQREARERAEREQREALKKARDDAKYVCARCGVRATKRCGGCEAVRYCNQECLTTHWPEHQLVCEELKEAAAEAKAARAAARAAAAGAAAQTEEAHGNCWTCGADDPPVKCGECRVAKYCGEACQTENWPIHKGRCSKLKMQTAVFDEAKVNIKKVKAGDRRSLEAISGLLHNACLLGRIVDIERIIAAGGNVNDPYDINFRPLNLAAQEGHARAIDVLVRHGAQVDARNLKGNTACHFASQNGQLKAVAALLEHGAQVNSRNNNGVCALFAASQHNHPEVVALLLQAGAQVDLPTDEGGTPLIISAQEGHAAVARFLLQHGAHVDLRTTEGSSPLFFASQNNHPEVVALLLEAGAQVDMPNKIRETPLLISAQRGHVAVVRLLLQHGPRSTRETRTATALCLWHLSATTSRSWPFCWRRVPRSTCQPRRVIRPSASLLRKATWLASASCCRPGPIPENKQATDIRPFLLPLAITTLRSWPCCRPASPSWPALAPSPSSLAYCPFVLCPVPSWGWLP